MTYNIITISREFGSGGRTVGRIVAQTLGIPCYDQELIEKMAEESGFTPAYVREHSEYAAHTGGFLNALAGRDFNGLSAQDHLWIVQRNVILELARSQPCVIVGRCADFILQDRADCLRAFIHADPDKRAARIVRTYGERDDEPKKRLRDKDKRRAAYYQFYTDRPWGRAQNYHICLDSGVLGLNACAWFLCSLCRPDEK